MVKPRGGANQEWDQSGGGGGACGSDHPFIYSMCLRAEVSCHALQMTFVPFCFRLRLSYTFQVLFIFPKKGKLSQGPCLVAPGLALQASKDRCAQPLLVAMSTSSLSPGLWQVYLAATFLTSLFKICTF